MSDFNGLALFGASTALFIFAIIFARLAIDALKSGFVEEQEEIWKRVRNNDDR